MNHLNERAAKALKWRHESYPKHGFDVPMNIRKMFRLSEEADVIRVGSLLFDSSYDWAMLLVAECNKRMYGLEEYIVALSKKLGYSALPKYYYGEDITYDNCVEEMLSATPAQISEAALTVLEGNKEDE